MKKLWIETLGCRVNLYESEGMRERLLNKGFEPAKRPEEADLLMVNSCMVTHTAAQKTVKALHRFRKLAPGAVLMVCGCYAEHRIMEENGLSAQDYVKAVDGRTAPLYLLTPGDSADVWVSNACKKDIFELYEAFLNQRADLTRQELSAPDLFITTQDQHTRAFLKVQDGCRSFCSYCIISYVRGDLTSKPLSVCVAEAKGLVEAGYQELVLTGIQLSAYQDEKEHSDLGDLIFALGQIEGLQRIRLGSLEPRVITDAFIEKVKDVKKLMPHFHLALQSGSDSVLKRMNRHYTTAEYSKACQKLREAFPRVAFTTDFMVSFPGETDEEFEESLSFAEKIGFADMHVFQYSPREGTVAARLPGRVSFAVSKERSERAIALAEWKKREFIETQKGKEFTVLLEQPTEQGFVGYSDNYIETYVKGLPEDSAFGQGASRLVRVRGLGVNECGQQEALAL